MLIVDWLEHTGLGFDVITDEDLHPRGACACLGRRAGEAREGGGRRRRYIMPPPVTTMVCPVT